jgi:hypothetical protein
LFHGEASDGEQTSDDGAGCGGSSGTKEVDLNDEE